MAKEKGLSFMEFTSIQGITPTYDNFPLFFTKGADPEIRRTRAPYIELQRQTPNLERRLREGISRLPLFSSETLKPFNLDLYTAYLIMRQYVDADEELGIPR